MDTDYAKATFGTAADMLLPAAAPASPARATASPRASLMSLRRAANGGPAPSATHIAAAAPEYDSGTEDEDGDEPDDDDESLEEVAPIARLLPSLYKHRKATVFVDYPPELNLHRDASRAHEPTTAKGARACASLRFNCYWERNSVKNALARAGFSRSASKLCWNVLWGKHLTHDGFASLSASQKANHFPGSWCIGRKDRLMRTINKARRAQGREFAFIPEGFNLPSEWATWTAKCKVDKNSVWIVKPAASSCGRGIRLVSDRPGMQNLGSVSKERKYVMQRYLADPYLIDGYKWDMRLYVLCTSFDPLRCYMFNEGLARFSTTKYSMKNLKSRYTHLTNYSVNKKSKNFKVNEDEEVDGEGSKWSLTALKARLVQDVGAARAAQVWQEVEGVVVKTLIAAESELSPIIRRVVKHRGVCYELFGFDIMLDAHLKPWLIEVNISPSLMGASPLDRKIKGTLMADIFHLIGVRPAEVVEERRKQKESKGQASSGLGGSAPANSAVKAAVAKLKSGLSSDSGNASGATGSMSRAVMSRQNRQAAWRTAQTPQSVKLTELTDDEWGVVHESAEEFSRLGHFDCIYPAPATVQRYLPLFESPRFHDALVARLVLDPSGIARADPFLKLMVANPELKHSPGGAVAAATARRATPQRERERAVRPPLRPADVASFPDPAKAGRTRTPPGGRTRTPPGRQGLRRDTTGSSSSAAMLPLGGSADVAPRVGGRISVSSSAPQSAEPTPRRRQAAAAATAASKAAVEASLAATAARLASAAPSAALPREAIALTQHLALARAARLEHLQGGLVGTRPLSANHSPRGDGAGPKSPRDKAIQAHMKARAEARQRALHRQLGYSVAPALGLGSGSGLDAPRAAAAAVAGDAGGQLVARPQHRRVELPR